ncbi:MAG: GGDEF domain-containing protein [Anaerolineaceae bacterium]
MNSKNINRQLYFLPTLLSLWLIISSALLAWLDPKYFLVLLLFMLVVCILCLSHKLRVAGWILAVIGSALFFGLHVSLSGVTGYEIRIISLGVVALLGAAVLCTFTAEQLNDISTQIKYSRKMIEELRIVDPVSGLIRFHYARKSLNTEVARSQRYSKFLCLMVVRVANWNDIVEHRGPDASQQIMAQVGDQFRRSVRNTDIAYINIEKIGVILPETKIEGAIRVAQRVVENCSKKVKIDLNIGIASFPEDATQDSELIRTTEAALQISMSSGQPIVLYSQIKKELEIEPIQPASPEKRTVQYGDQPSKNLSEQMILQSLPPYQEDDESLADKGLGSSEIWKEAESTGFPPEREIPPIPSYLSGGEPQATIPAPQPVIENADIEKGKSDWVKPYKPPLSNLELESKSDEQSHEGELSAGLNEIPVGIHGVEQISDLPEIEKAIMTIPAVSNITMVDYADQTLVISLTHSSENILDDLKTSLSLPYEDIHGSKDWIDITLKKTE